VRPAGPPPPPMGFPPPRDYLFLQEVSILLLLVLLPAEVPIHSVLPCCTYSGRGLFSAGVSVSVFIHSAAVFCRGLPCLRPLSPAWGLHLYSCILQETDYLQRPPLAPHTAGCLLQGTTYVPYLSYQAASLPAEPGECSLLGTTSLPC
jgi:hypothetical protein